MEGKDAAFPTQPVRFLAPGGGECVAVGGDGLTKREYFAALAIQGIAATGCIVSGGIYLDPGDAAKTAVKYADALINELNKEISP